MRRQRSRAIVVHAETHFAHRLARSIGSALLFPQIDAHAGSTAVLHGVGKRLLDTAEHCQVYCLPITLRKGTNGNAECHFRVAAAKSGHQAVDQLAQGMRPSSTGRSRRSRSRFMSSDAR